MLPTVCRAAPRARRALTTGTALRAPLAPPYSHSVRPALAPPYTHPLAHVPEEQRLRAPYAFSLLRENVQPAQPTPLEWVESALETQAGREWVEATWAKTLAELAEQPLPVEVSFQALGEILADPTAREAIKRAGSIVVRDVVRDSVAEAWASELTEALTARSQQPTYHHDAQVAARADPSVLSATSQVLRAFLPDVAPEGAFVRIDAASATPAQSNWADKDLWAVDETASPATPVHGHLALARTEVKVPTSAAAATYALLRPFFAPNKSRIAFYLPHEYIEPSNWALRRGKPEADADLVHVRPATVSLTPGDIVLSHAGLRLTAADESGLVLPVHPLPATEGNRAYVALQRAAFEAGLPPPHVASDGSPIALEEGGDVSMIESWGGRRAMGYGF